jgi:hypothetical protein
MQLVGKAAKYIAIGGNYAHSKKQQIIVNYLDIIINNINLI